MRGVVIRQRLAWLALMVTMGWGVVPAVQAFEAFDGRLQAHGFFESQLRFINRDFGEYTDMTQWYNILNVEFELDIIDEEPLGPVDLLSAFVRVEARYDCIYSEGCGMIRSVNTYGNDSKELPHRLNNSEEIVAAGSIWLRNDGRRSMGSRDPVPLGLMGGFRSLAEEPGLGPVNIHEIVNNDDARYVHTIPDRFLDAERPAPFEYTMWDFRKYKVTQINWGTGGTANGNPFFILGPWLPKNFVETLNGAMANRVNPFDTSRRNPVTARNGIGALPMRPVPIYNEDTSRWDTIPHTQDNPALGHMAGDLETLNATNFYRVADNKEARGLYMPSKPLRDYLSSGTNREYFFNFSEGQRAWNHGASQQDTGELKEAYFDIEMMDSRLWVRLGKQTIVWGKTELFPTVDQWNPQDLALGSLVSLEESRIGLWAVRGVYSFYEVGPLEDFRVELAANLQPFEPADLGGCGEPYTVNVACGLPMGSFAHSFAGIGIAGIDRPRSPWKSADGWEIGGRVEFRWDRYSFAISDFWGYNDFPYIRRLSTYQRNVDPNTGRPRIINGYGPCTTQDWLGYGDFVDGKFIRNGDERPVDKDCLRPGPQYNQDFAWVTYDQSYANRPGFKENRFYALEYKQEVVDGQVRWARDEDGNKIPNELERDPITNEVIAGYIEHNSLEYHPANMTLFSFACSASLTVITRDRGGCGITAFSSPARGKPSSPSNISLTSGLGGLLAGNAFLNSLAAADSLNVIPFMMPLVSLDANWPSDLQGYDCISSYASQPAPNEVRQVGCGGELLGSGGNEGIGSILGAMLSPEQEALLGCGPFFLTSCDREGIDWLFSDASAMLQSFIGWDNDLTHGKDARTYRTDNKHLKSFHYNPYYDPEKLANAPDSEKWRYALKRRFQPGTLDFMLARGPTGRPIAGPACTTGDLKDGVQYNHATGAGVLPGCRTSKLLNANNEYIDNPNYDPSEDGSADFLEIAANDVEFLRYYPSPEDTQRLNCLGKRYGSEFPDYADICSQVFRSNHPLTGESFASEMAALSWNLQVLVTSTDDEFQSGLESVNRWATEDALSRFPGDPMEQENYVKAWEKTYAYTGSEEATELAWEELQIPWWKKVDEDVEGNNIYIPTDLYVTNDHCSYVTPQYCPVVQQLLSAAGQKRNTLEAGGNGVFGRRTFAWHSGGEVAVRYQKRNVLGFAMDFAEDRTKSNWGIEATWIRGVNMFDNDAWDNVDSSDEFNVTIAMDRPTFINFLNPNRTFFITTQWFVTYRPGYQQGWTSNGPWNVLGMVFLQTGYFQDRLVGNTVFLYDVMSNSGGALASVMYRISENFSVTFGAALFMGRAERVNMPVNEIGPASNRLGSYAYEDSVENGISAIRDRDELYLRLRYTF